MPLVHHLRRNTIAYLALFAALSGGAYAATTLPPNSVGTVQVKNHSLLTVDFKPGQIPAGKRGPKGPPGQFDASDVATAQAPFTSLCGQSGGSCAVATSNATCPSGSVAVGGGWIPDPNNPVIGTVVLSAPISGGTWGVIMLNLTDNGGNFAAVAQCASAGTARVAQSRVVNLAALRQRVLARLGSTR
jgi:hypothetical protein